MELDSKDTIGENVIGDQMRMFNCSCDEDAAVIPLNFEKLFLELKELENGEWKEVEEDLIRLQLLF